MNFLNLRLSVKEVQGTRRMRGKHQVEEQNQQKNMIEGSVSNGKLSR